MRPNNRYAPLYSIGLILLAIAALVYVVAALSVDSLGELRLRQLAWWFFPAITALHVLFLLLSAEVWRRVVRALTAARTGYVQAYLQMAVIAVGKYVPGKIWGFIARAGQMSREQVPLHKSITSGVVEQILDPPADRTTVFDCDAAGARTVDIDANPRLPSVATENHLDDLEPDRLDRASRKAADLVDHLGLFFRHGGLSRPASAPKRHKKRWAPPTFPKPAPL